MHDVASAALAVTESELMAGTGSSADIRQGLPQLLTSFLQGQMVVGMEMPG